MVLAVESFGCVVPVGRRSEGGRWAGEGADGVAGTVAVAAVDILDVVGGIVGIVGSAYSC